jgi:hypothetical protein
MHFSSLPYKEVLSVRIWILHLCAKNENTTIRLVEKKWSVINDNADVYIYESDLRTFSTCCVVGLPHVSKSVINECIPVTIWKEKPWNSWCLSPWHCVHHKFQMDWPGIESGPPEWEPNV